jgi:hypothetical protein
MPVVSRAGRKKRRTFILHLWVREGDESEWIGEIQDVQTGELAPVKGGVALSDWLKQKLEPTPARTEKNGASMRVQMKKE